VFSGIIVLAVYLVRQSIVLWLSKKLAAYKTELDIERERQLSALRHEFEKALLEHQISFQQIYTQRHLALSELHKSIQEAVKLAFRALGPKGDPDVTKAIEAVNIVNEKISEHEIYLPSKFCDKWRKVLGEAYFSLHDLPNARAQRTSDWPGDQKQLAAVVESCFEQLQKLNGEIADDFRNLIGVADK
jgi:hypothetical protein